QEKYDFILRRIVQITRSEEGYLALVDTAQSHITICSYFVVNNQNGKNKKELTTPRTIADGGLPGRAVLKKTSVIANTADLMKEDDNFPYHHAVSRHLDVPIYNDGKIVVVAGVCNNEE